MNLFYLSKNPEECSRLHCDKHCVKMVVEYGQLLSTAHHVIDGDQARKGIYKVTHKNHPSAVWVRESVEHYIYVRDLLEALCAEYTYRYGKVHKTEREVLPLLMMPPKNMPMNGGWVEPPQCMDDHCKESNAIDGYKTYYRVEKAYMAKWKVRPTPAFMFDKKDLHANKNTVMV